MVPKKDIALLAWSRNFTQRIVSAAGHFGVPQAKVDELADKQLAFDAAYTTQKRELAAGVRSMSLTTTKDQTKAALQTIAREIYATIAASRTIPSADKIELGIHVRQSGPSPIGRPEAAPWLTVKSVIGRRVTVHVMEANSTRKGKPPGCAGAILFSVISDKEPTGIRQWRSEGLMTRPTKIISFNDAEPGQKVWLCAAWYSPRGETGAASTPVSTYTGFGGATPLVMLRAA